MYADDIFRKTSNNGLKQIAKQLIAKIVRGNTKGSFTALKWPWDRNWWKRWVSGNKSSEEAIICNGCPYYK